MLTLGFTELGLHAVSAWAVEPNTASVGVLKRNNFQFVGRQRHSHWIDGRPFDRLLFDLLASEHRSP
jgi:RimJ/RimL family protein N-acetyltransferase